MRFTRSDADLMIVEHTVGYAFVFRVHDQAEVDLVDQHWEGVGPAPDAVGSEQEARRFAEMRVQAIAQA